MSKAPSIYSATVILAVFLCLGMTPSRANACSECLCFPGDNTCTDVECSTIPTANCVRTEFSPSCTATYTIYTETRCTGSGICSKCRSCASVFKVSGGVEEFLGNGHTNACAAGNCITTIAPTVSLIAGVTYAIYVCKLPCPTFGANCESCPNTCTAYACVHTSDILSCTP